MAIPPRKQWILMWTTREGRLLGRGDLWARPRTWGLGQSPTHPHSMSQADPWVLLLTWILLILGKLPQTLPGALHIERWHDGASWEEAWQLLERTVCFLWLYCLYEKKKSVSWWSPNHSLTMTSKISLFLKTVYSRQSVWRLTTAANLLQRGVL